MDDRQRSWLPALVVIPHIRSGSGRMRRRKTYAKADRRSYAAGVFPVACAVVVCLLLTVWGHAPVLPVVAGCGIAVGIAVLRGSQAYLSRNEVAT